MNINLFSCCRPTSSQPMSATENNQKVHNKDISILKSELKQVKNSVLEIKNHNNNKHSDTKLFAFSKKFNLQIKIKTTRSKIDENIVNAKKFLDKIDQSSYAHNKNKYPDLKKLITEFDKEKTELNKESKKFIEHEILLKEFSEFHAKNKTSSYDAKIQRKLDAENPNGGMIK